MNLAAETVSARFDPARTRVAAIAAAVNDSGYEVPTAETTLQIQGMHCASCVGRVERFLGQLPGVLEATVNLASEQAHVRYIQESSPSPTSRARWRPPATT